MIILIMIIVIVLVIHGIRESPSGSSELKYSVRNSFLIAGRKCEVA